MIGINQQTIFSKWMKSSNKLSTARLSPTFQFVGIPET
jgi:hypothetical protein